VRCMDKIEIPYDFNGYLRYGDKAPVPLSKADYIIDTTGNEILLYEGLNIRIYEIDYDVFGNQDNLYADGVATCSPVVDNDISDDIWWHSFKWWFQINNLGIKHESDDLK